MLQVRPVEIGGLVEDVSGGSMLGAGCVMLGGQNAPLCRFQEVVEAALNVWNVLHRGGGPVLCVLVSYSVVSRPMKSVAFQSRLIIAGSVCGCTMRCRSVDVW